MSDIFISYSSKDREKAEQITELLGSAGLSVWIDKSGIDIATSWSGEIVDAIEACKAFVVLLSPSSIESLNVIKEVSIAAEQKKKILPLDLEPVELPRDLKYHLAGIQRSPITNTDAIIRALEKIGVARVLTRSQEERVETPSTRKTLMILPFEDLSPSQDNSWFTDGIASEMVNTLSNVKALKVIDWNTSSMLKNKKVRTVDLAKDFSVRYFIEGQVRKSGEQIKISMNLLDIETGDHLWQDSLRGVMDDIFDIQEKCAAKVLEGLKLHLTSEEQEKVKKKPTENAEAYEMFLKGLAYANRRTKSDFERALVLFEEALRLDPRFSDAYASIASICQALYRLYSHSEALLARVETAARKVREIEGETAQYFGVMSATALNLGDVEGALSFAMRAVKTDSAYAPGYNELGNAYEALGLYEEAAQAREEAVRLLENNTTAHFNLLIALNELGDAPDARERLRIAAERAIPAFERHVRLNPDDYDARVKFANVFRYAGRESDALAESEKLSAVESLDGAALYNLACLYLHYNKPERGMAMLRRSVERGFRSIEVFRRDPDLDSLRGMAEFEELVASLSAV